MRHRAIVVLTLIFIGVAALVFTACGTVLKLDVGTCFDDPDSLTEVTDVPVVECSEPHDNEVIANFDLPEGSYPGDDSVTIRAQEGCLDRFESYVGVDYASSAYAIGWLNPTEDSWSSGDREIICFVYDAGLGKVTGSVRGIAA